MSRAVFRKIWVMTFAGSLALAQMATAASDTCWMVSQPYTCQTRSIPANPNGHFVHIDISPRVAYVVKDSVNGAVVSSGTSGWTGTRKTITGLYGRYHIESRDVGPFRAFATINNN
jgi:hypothetical protein